MKLFLEMRDSSFTFLLVATSSFLSVGGVNGGVKMYQGYGGSLSPPHTPVLV